MKNKFKSCCFTGYRPAKFPFPLDKSNNDYIDFESALNKAVFSMPQKYCYTFYTGMAMGFDIIAAEAVLLLREKCSQVRLICAVPFIEQARNFSPDWKERYERILSLSDETVLISDNYFSGCYGKRNRFMVENSDYIMTWFDGLPGGTRNTINYARKKGKTVINLCSNILVAEQIRLPDQ